LPPPDLGGIVPLTVLASIRAPGLTVRSALASASAASGAAPSSRSSTNTARVVAVVSRVRVHCRQFQRRQVTPASSRQTTSPGSGCSTTGSPAAVVSNGSSPAARVSRIVPAYESRSSPPTGTAYRIETALYASVSRSTRGSSGSRRSSAATLGRVR